jgi:type II secretory pathway pseudopilin PulG
LKRNQAGFTLREVLAAALIVCALGLAIIPGMVAARREKLRETCILQMRVIRSMYHQYLMDTPDSSSRGNLPGIYTKTIGCYLATGESYTCPLGGSRYGTPVMEADGSPSYPTCPHAEEGHVVPD